MPGIMSEDSGLECVGRRESYLGGNRSQTKRQFLVEVLPSLTPPAHRYR